MVYREVTRDPEPIVFSSIPVRIAGFPVLQRTDNPTFTPGGIDVTWRSFYKHFTKVPTFLQWPLWSDEERVSATLVIMKKRLSEFVTDILLQTETPVTIQFLLYILDLYSKLYTNAPDLALVRAFAAQFTVNRTTWTRSRFARAISDASGLFWLDAQSARRLEEGLRNDPITAEQKLPSTWFFDESPGRVIQSLKLIQIYVSKWQFGFQRCTTSGYI